MKAAVETRDRLLEPLQKDLAIIVKTHSTNYLRARARLFNKKNALQTCEDDDDYIPRSARIAPDFKLTASMKTVDSSQERLDFLEGQAQQAIRICQKALKATIVETMKLDIENMRNDVMEHYMVVIHDTTLAFITNKGLQCDVQQKVSNLLQEHYLTLFYTCPSSNLERIRGIYESHFNVELPEPTTFTFPASPPITQEETRTTATGATTASQDVANVDNDELKTILINACRTPWEDFLSQYDQNQRDLNLKKMASEILHSKTTEETAMELDNEAPVDREHLNELIRKAVEDKTRHLSSALGETKKQLSNLQKNDSGRRRANASSQQKTGQNSRGRNNNDNKTTNRRGNRSRSRSRSRSRNNNRTQTQSQPNQNQGAGAVSTALSRGNWSNTTWTGKSTQNLQSSSNRK